MQVVVGIASVRQRPVGLVTPLVAAHDEEAHRRLVEDAVFGSFEPVVEPRQAQLVEVACRLGPKIDVASLAGVDGGRSVHPGSDDELLSAPRRLGASSSSQAGVILERACQKDVKPAAEVVDRGLDLVVAAGDGQLPPVWTVFGVREEVVVPVAETSQESARVQGEPLVPVVDVRLYVIEEGLLLDQLFA